MQDIEILKPGLFTTIQDHGRKSVAYYAIPSGGAMDTDAYEKSNLIVNNPIDYPVVECTIMPPEILFHQERHIALTGADMKWMINGILIQRYKTIYVNKGDILSGKPSRDGARAYIAIAGLIDTQNHYGSYSSYTYASLGGNSGNRLSKGDFLAIKRGTSQRTMIEMSIPESYLQLKSISFERGPEWNLVSDEGKKKMQSQTFKLSAVSNRMGARLLDNKIEANQYNQMSSVPVFPGIIQLPPSGEPIILLQDGQTTGGYPRIGIINKEELNRFNQLLPNTSIYLTLN